MTWKIGTIVLGLAVFVLMCVVLSLWQENRIAHENLDYYRSTYLHKSGWAGRFNLNYHLFSNDGGKNWYVLEGSKIVGNVQEVRPGLLEHVLALDALMKYVHENGPIQMDDEKGLDLLRAAGFEAVKK